MQQKVCFQIEGMTCQACASRIERVLSKKDSVESAGVNFVSEETQMVFDDSQTSADDIAKIIKKTGYGAKEKTEDTLPQPGETVRVSWRLWLLLTISIPFLIDMMGMMIDWHGWMTLPLWQFVLASMVRLWLAVPFYKSTWAGIKDGLASMGVFVTVSMVSIYLYSVYISFFSPHTAYGMAHAYFEADVMVTDFVSLDKFLEHRTKKSSLNSLDLPLKLTPTQVNVQCEGGRRQLPIDQVQIGDLVRANHDERIAADGIIGSGSGWADESHFTGESNPEEKKAGGRVLAGALITEDNMVCHATQLGSQTLLGDMMSTLFEAQGNKAPIARVVDKTTVVFVLTVVDITLLTFIAIWLLKGDWTIALIHAIAALAIACPCAFGLVTPTTTIVSMGEAVKHDIWFRDAAAMEEAAHVNTAVLDKTGTLTEGGPQAVTVYCVPDSGSDGDTLCRIAATAEQSATHPLTRATVSAAQTRGLGIPAIQNAQTVIGVDIATEVEGTGLVKADKAKFAELTLPEFSDDVWSIASIVTASANGEPIGTFALADALKTDTAEIIGRPKKHGIDVYIISNDNQDAVGYVAKQLGIAHTFGNMNPRDKAAEVQKFKAVGKTVAMVGDGINDTLTLAAANIGFAMKGGADVAEHTASAALMQHSVNQLAGTLLVSQAALKNIKQDPSLAFFYNILGISLAALGFLNPVIAGAAMAASSVSVLSNALYLKRVNIE